VIARAVFGVAVLLATACQITNSNAPGFVVSYDLTAGSGVSCDSVKYENAVGIVQVPSPPLPWSYAFMAQPGGHLQVTAWMTSTGAGQPVKLKATWSATGGGTAGDSTFGTTTAAGKFTLVVPRRPL
jgi:hypothetical protein